MHKPVCLSMQAKNGLQTPKAVMASEAWQSSFWGASTTHGSPRRCAPRDEVLMKIAPQQVNS